MGHNNGSMFNRSRRCISHQCNHADGLVLTSGIYIIFKYKYTVVIMFVPSEISQSVLLIMESGQMQVMASHGPKQQGGFTAIRIEDLPCGWKLTMLHWSMNIAELRIALCS